MLRQDVVDAVKEGKFHVYPVHTIDEGIEILTGVKAGEKLEDGSLEKDTLNAIVDEELQRLAKSWKTFSSAQEEKGKES